MRGNLALGSVTVPERTEEIVVDKGVRMELDAGIPLHEQRRAAPPQPDPTNNSARPTPEGISTAQGYQEQAAPQAATAPARGRMGRTQIWQLSNQQRAQRREKLPSEAPTARPDDGTGQWSIATHNDSQPSVRHAAFIGAVIGGYMGGWLSKIN